MYPAPKTAREHRFLFPESIKQKMVFNSTTEILNFLGWEAEKKGLVANFYYRDPKHPYIDGEKFNLVCNACENSLHFILRSKRLVATKVERQHTHQTDRQMGKPSQKGCFLSQQVIDRMDYLTDRKGLAPRQRELSATSKVLLIESLCVTPAHREASNKLGSDISLKLKQPMAESRMFEPSIDEPMSKDSPIQSLNILNESLTSRLCEWMQSMNYVVAKETIEIHNGSKATDRQLLLAASPTMKNNFSRYGDVVSLEVLREAPVQFEVQLSHQQVCLLVVSDTNNRPLLAAVGLLPDCSAKSISWALDKITKMHGHLGTIITPYQEAFKEGIALYQSQFPFCHHVYDNNSVTRSVSRQAGGSDDDKRRATVTFSEALSTRSPDIYLRNIDRLMNNPESTNIISKILEEKHKIFSCSMQGEFVGLKRDAGQRFQHSIKTAFPEKASLDKFFVRLHEITELATNRSNTEFTEYASSAESDLQDERVKEVRQCFERDVVQRFVENYTAGLMDLQISDEFSNGSLTCYVVQLLNKKERYVVRDSRCPCKEHKRTGIPCCHILAAALFAKLPSYVGLFNRRWLKHQPQILKRK